MTLTKYCHLSSTIRLCFLLARSRSSSFPRYCLFLPGPQPVWSSLMEYLELFHPLPNAILLVEVPELQ